MSRHLIRQCIVYLLASLLPLQVFAASGMTLCAEMNAASSNAKHTDHCAQMKSMSSQSTVSSQSSAEKSSLIQNKGCWLGSICLASLILPPIPVNYADVNFERSTPVYIPQTALYHSIISENLLRPPASL